MCIMMQTLNVLSNRFLLFLVILVSLGITPSNGWLPSVSSFQEIAARTVGAWGVNVAAGTKEKRSLVELTDQDIAQVRAVLSEARVLGPVGVFRSITEQDNLLASARSLGGGKIPVPMPPTSIPLVGTHRLVYSAAPGGSSGKLMGRVAGTVTQQFLNTTHFINAVTLGPIKIELLASRDVIDAERINVTFHETTVNVVGNPLIRKPVSGGGQWKYIWAGVIPDETDPTRKILVRIMETPSLFVLEHVMGADMP